MRCAFRQYQILFRYYVLKKWYWITLVTDKCKVPNSAGQGALRDDAAVTSRFGIVHEDAELLAINKPADLVCHPNKNDELSSLIGRVCLYLAQTDIRPQLGNCGEIDAALGKDLRSCVAIKDCVCAEGLRLKPALTCYAGSRAQAYPSHCSAYYRERAASIRSASTSPGAGTRSSATRFTAERLINPAGSSRPPTTIKQSNNQTIKQSNAPAPPTRLLPPI
jgi:hypothetical protein